MTQPPDPGSAGRMTTPRRSLRVISTNGCFEKGGTYLVPPEIAKRLIELGKATASESGADMKIPHKAMLHGQIRKAAM